MQATTDPYPFDRARLHEKFADERLQAEVAALLKSFPPYIYYSVIPLTVAGQAAPDVGDFSDPDWTTWEQTPALSESPYLLELLDSLDCRKTNVRLLRLEPGGVVKKHTDPQLNLALRNQVRLHVPIFLGEGAQFFLNDHSVDWQPGELWYLRLSDPHYVVNDSSTERVQLSIDVVFDDWIEEAIVAAADAGGAH